MDNAIKGMLAGLDPYTVYFNEQDVVKFKINNTGYIPNYFVPETIKTMIFPLIRLV
jgi:C-terminal processing protease CtpA/Prc